MVNLCKWKGSIKKFASNVSFVLIQQNALATTCQAVLQRQSKVRAVLEDMQGNEVFINMGMHIPQVIKENFNTFPQDGQATCSALQETWKAPLTLPSSHFNLPSKMVLLSQATLPWFSLFLWHEYDSFNAASISDDQQQQTCLQLNTKKKARKGFYLPLNINIHTLFNDI